MPKFTDAEPKQFFSKPGDYIFQVLSFDKKLSRGPKTTGCDLYELKIGVEQNGKVVSELYENLVDHDSMRWKWDCFLKSAGVKLVKGEDYSFDKSEAEANEWRFIEIRGLRGWFTIGMKPPRNATDSAKYNEVIAWITNKEKLLPVAPPVEQPEDPDDIPF
jgi:hypothetical protein